MLNNIATLASLRGDLEVLKDHFPPIALLVVYKDNKPFMELHFDSIGSSTNLEWKSVYVDKGEGEGGGIKPRKKFFDSQGELFYDIGSTIHAFHKNFDHIKQQVKGTLPDSQKITYTKTSFGEYIFAKYEVVRERKKLSNNEKSTHDLAVHVSNSLYIPDEQDTGTKPLEDYVAAFEDLLKHLKFSDGTPPNKEAMADFFKHCKKLNDHWPNVESRNNKHLCNIKLPIEILTKKDFYINAYLARKILLPDRNSMGDAIEFINQCEEMKKIISACNDDDLKVTNTMLDDTILFLKAKLVQVKIRQPHSSQNLVAQEISKDEKSYRKVLEDQKTSFDTFRKTYNNNSFIEESYGKIKKALETNTEENELMYRTTLFQSIEQHFQDMVTLPVGKYTLAEVRGHSKQATHCTAIRCILGHVLHDEKLQSLEQYKSRYNDEKQQITNCNRPYQKLEEAGQKLMASHHKMEEDTPQNHDVTPVGATSTEYYAH